MGSQCWTLRSPGPHGSRSQQEEEEHTTHHRESQLRLQGKLRPEAPTDTLLPRAPDIQTLLRQIRHRLGLGPQGGLTQLRKVWAGSVQTFCDSSHYSADCYVQ